MVLGLAPVRPICRGNGLRRCRDVLVRHWRFDVQAYPEDETVSDAGVV
jgi:hypothetical protein